MIPSGSLLQPGVKLTIDQGSTVQIPYVICLTNACVAGSVATESLVQAMEMGQTLFLETVNLNLLSAINSIPLKGFADVHRGAPTRVFEQRLDGDWRR
jgi:invasion protein IalB